MVNNNSPSFSMDKLGSTAGSHLGESWLRKQINSKVRWFQASSEFSGKMFFNRR